MESDPSVLAYAVGAITAVVTLVNTQRGEGPVGILKWLIVACIAGGIVGAGLYGVLGGFAPR